ncbi:MAG TPA: STAS domain-containing protein [Acidobacteriaceae bacterium]|nr:STAS domain-containing protein [Acidobacteriaceae bacterium]
MEEQGSQRRARRSSAGHAEKPPAVAGVRLHPERSGQWMEASALRQWALEQLNCDEPARELVIDLEGLEHLDASALQVLLALRAEQVRRGGVLRFEHASPGLRPWFVWAGAAECAGFAEPGKQAAAEKGEDA